MNVELKERIEMINRGEVPEGYKKTRVGIIPEDWEVKGFDKLFNFSGGYPLPREKLGDEGVCYLHYGDIHTGKKSFININKEWKTIPKTDLDAEKISTSYYLNDADIVFADASEDYEGIGKSITIINETKLPFIAGLHTIIAKDKTDLVYRDYKRYFMLNHNVRKQFMFYATGISVLGISMNNIKKIIVSLPSKKEQQKIAQILSTWDEAIELKEKLIEGKQEQKRGLMQKLLTGNVRLPGFEGEWEEVRLGEVLTFKKKEAVKNPQDYYLLTVKLHLEGIEATDNRPNKTKQGRPYYIREPGELLIGRQNFHNGGIGIVPDSMVNYVASNAISTLESKNNNIKFYYYYLSNSNFYRKIDHMIGGTGQKEISESMMKKLKLKIPCSLQEQKAIVDILSTADKEIELLTQELELLKLQKKGLMQLLLTGIVRVPIE